MEFKDVLNNFKKDIGLCYQSQKNVVDVAQRYIGELEKAYEGGGAGGINYSETEQDTGLKWIDGKKIYVKTIHETISSAMKNNWYNYAHGIPNIDKVIDYKAIMFSGNVTYMNSITPTNSNSGDGNVNGKNVFNIVYCGQSNMIIQLGNNYTIGDNIYFTIYYTKSS